MSSTDVEKRPLLGPINTPADETTRVGLGQRIKEFFKTCNIKMLFLLVGLILIATSNRVAFKIMTNALDFNKKYLTFVNQAINLAYMITFWPISWYLLFCTNRIAPETRAFPVWKYAVMGCFDAVASIFMIFGGARTSGPMQQLLIQGTILFTMLFSFIMTLAICERIVGSRLTVKYKWTHIVGALLIMGGIAVALGPKLADPSKNVNNDVGANILFFAADIPTAMSGVYKEIAFKKASLNVMLTNAWVATWQFVATVPTTLMSSIPGINGNETIPIEELPQAVWYGCLCFFNQNPLPDDKCVENKVWLRVSAYLAINILYNIMILLVIKYGSAALLYVSSAMLLPLANICFTQAWIMGEENATELSGFDIGGLVLILVGLILYRILPEGGEPADSKSELDEPSKSEDKQPMLAKDSDK